MTARVQGNKTKQNTQEVKHERLIIWTRQNNVHIFGKFCLGQRDERTNIHG